MESMLNEIEARILGCLIEKQTTTPDYYPLTLNATTNACNQKSNRFPVMQISEASVDHGLDTLREKHFVSKLHEAGSRVPKFQHEMDRRLDLEKGEIAVLAELMLRGPQTPGEIKTRASRMHPFGDLSEVEAIIEKLGSGEDPKVTRLERQPGQKESRYAQLLCASKIEPAQQQPDAPTRVRVAPASEASSELKEEVAALRRELDNLRREFDEFKAGKADSDWTPTFRKQHDY